jgi:hypothetical protein
MLPEELPKNDNIFSLKVEFHGISNVTGLNNGLKQMNLYQEIKTFAKDNKLEVTKINFGFGENEDE